MSDGFMLFAGNLAAANSDVLMVGLLTWKSILLLIVGIVSIAAVLFIDWWTLIIYKEFKLDFDIWMKIKPSRIK